MAKQKNKLQTFNIDQNNYISKGIVHQSTLRSQINEALNHNRFKQNYIISSLPGLGKSFEIEKALGKMKKPPLKFQGSSGIYTLTIDIATAVYLNKRQPFVVVLDDCDVLFENKNMNITKKMFDDARILKYGKNYTSLKPLCTDLQWEALESFADPARAGLDIPVDMITFIILTNIYFEKINDVEKLEEGTPKYANANARYAIRRRTAFKEIKMSPEDLWGYVTNVVMNEKICEKWMPQITMAHKTQIASWLYANWSSVTERNLSLVEKMTQDIVKYPRNYLDVWTQEYLEVV